MAAYSTPRGVLPMLLALLAILQVTVAIGHGAHHHHRSTEDMEAPAEMKRFLAERANNIAITGVSGSVGVRIEVRDLKNNADQWNLYLLGMERFMAKPKNDRMSYYQIAGVHGRPFTTWNNFPTPLVNNAGFCPHRSILFGSWHRPYLAIYEQAWYQSVQEVIATFPSNQQQRWRNAANGLRMPFFDWARYPGSNQPAVPQFLRDKQVTVTKPQGQVVIDNPLYSYTWGSSLPSEMGGGPWSNWPITLRRPVGNPTRSNNNEVNDRMGSIRISLRDRIYAIFMSGASWGLISNSQLGARTAASGNSVDSIESVHDAVHVTVGGESQGTMYYLDYSAFDPMFWLHHTNIDRFLAMYQIVSPSTYVAVGKIGNGMAQWNVGEEKNSNSPLKPFTKNTNGDYFTSNDVYNTRTLGYVYQDTDNTNADTVRRAVNNLYGPNTPSRKRSVSEYGQYEGRPFVEGDYHTILSVVADKYALPGSYSIHCFVGNSASNSTNSTAPYSNSTAPYSNTTAPYPTNSTSSAPYSNTTSDYDFTHDPNYVGNYAVLGATHSSSGDDSLLVLTGGSLPLTTCLQGKQASGELKSLHPDHVEPYLAENLYYKVIGPGGVEIPADQLPNLHISVKSCPVTPAQSADEFPSLGEYTTLPKATEDKPAGKPFTYVPNDLDIVKPGNDETWTPEYPSPSEGKPQPTKVPTSYPSGTSPNHYPTGTITFPYPTAPESESGYCVSHQVVKYVDTDGNFLYDSM